MGTAKVPGVCQFDDTRSTIVGFEIGGQLCLETGNLPKVQAVLAAKRMEDANPASHPTRSRRVGRR